MAQPATRTRHASPNGSRSRTHTWQPPTSYADAGTHTGIELVRMGLGTTPTLRCEGRAVHVGLPTATAEARLVGAADGRLFAHGTATCAVLALPGVG